VEGCDAPLVMVGNVKLSTELQLACQQTIKLLRSPMRSAEHVDVIDEALECQKRVREALGACQFDARSPKACNTWLEPHTMSIKV